MRYSSTKFAIFGNLDTIERFDALLEDLDELGGAHQLRGGEVTCHGDNLRHPLVVDFLRVALVDFVGSQGSVHGLDGIHRDKAPQHVEAEVEPELEARVHALVVHTGRDDGNVLESGLVEGLAGEYRVLHGTAVLAVLREAHRNFGLRNIGVIDEPLEGFADVHLAGEADIVVHELLAELDGFPVGHGQVFGDVAFALHVLARKHGKCGGEVRRKDTAALLVFGDERSVV